MLMQPCTCNHAHLTMHMQPCTCNHAWTFNIWVFIFKFSFSVRHIIWQTNKQASKMCLVYFKEYQTNKVWTRFIVWFIYAAIYDYTGVCVPTSILVNFFPIFLIFGLINRTPSWLQPHLCQISIEPHPKTHFEK